ncbi:THAP domain-containing protein 1-like [Hydractinia symbiolongicarpus]|uniref:THAP domain-containing protein 1-like n=1 Tax=Hydractinia symbiolongicarpus TaxID=13093 RepID=UPI002551C313|nr:THAP domain-containing protein 1-like [Hydractinia symbiolongicarpus]
MPHCCAHKCNNQSDNNDKVSYHKFPADPKLAQVWTQKHAQQQSEENGKEPSRKKIILKLVPGAVPTLFAYVEKKSSRETSSKRSEAKQRSDIVKNLLKEHKSNKDSSCDHNIPEMLRCY